MKKCLACACVAVGGVLPTLFLAIPAAASDFGSQQGYQFNDANQQIANTATATLIEEKKGGAFHYTYNTTNNIGQQVNCNMAVSAVGNSAQPTNSASGISPTGVLNSGISATTTGNQGTATSTSGSSTGGLVGQSNSGSALNSSVGGSSVSSQIGAINASGAQISNPINTTQSNSGSSILATANDSSACAFSQASAKPVMRQPMRRTLLPVTGLALSLLCGACANVIAVQRQDGQYPQLVGPSVTHNTTPLEPSYACMTQRLIAAHPGQYKIGVGQIRDYTGKFSEADGGSAITQGGSLMAITALGKLRPAVRTFERFDTSVSEWELGSLSKRYLGDEQNHQINNNGQMQQVPWKPYMGGTLVGTDYFIVGGITELNYALYSGGVEIAFNQMGPSDRVFVANVAVDLRLVDTNTLEVLQTVSLQKQIVGYEVKAGIFNFFGTTLVDFEAGMKNNEPTQLAVRTTIEQAVLELLGPLAGLDAKPCLDYDPNHISEAFYHGPMSMQLSNDVQPAAQAQPAAAAPAATPAAPPPVPTAEQVQSFAAPPDTAHPPSDPGQIGPRGIGINASRRPHDPSGTGQ